MTDDELISLKNNYIELVKSGKMTAKDAFDAFFQVVEDEHEQEIMDLIEKFPEHIKNGVIEY